MNFEGKINFLSSTFTARFEDCHSSPGRVLENSKACRMRYNCVTIHGTLKIFEEYHFKEKLLGLRVHVRRRRRRWIRKHCRICRCRPTYKHIVHTYYIDNISHRHIYHHQSVLPKGSSFTANAGTRVAILSKGNSSTANPETKVAVSLGINRCCSFPFLSAPHSLFSVWTDIKRSEKVPRAPTWGKESGFGQLRPPDFIEIHHGGWISVSSGFLARSDYIYICVCVCVCVISKSSLIIIIIIIIIIINYIHIRRLVVTRW